MSGTVLVIWEYNSEHDRYTKLPQSEWSLYLLMNPAFNLALFYLFFQVSRIWQKTWLRIMLATHLFRIAKIKKKKWQNQVLVKMQHNQNSHTLPVGIQNGMAPLENSLTVS